MRKTPSSRDLQFHAKRRTVLAAAATMLLFALLLTFAALPQRVAAHAAAPVAQSTETPAEEPTSLPEEEATSTPVSTPTTASARATATATSRATTTATITTTTRMTGTVLVATLNVRSGPSTANTRVGAVRRGDQLNIFGATRGCTWLHIIRADGSLAWASGDPRYVELAGECDELPTVAIQPVATATRAASTPAPTSAPTQASAATQAATATAAATSTPLAEPTPAPTEAPAEEPTIAPTIAPTVAPTEEAAEDEVEDEAEDPGFPPGTGCVRIGNYIGPELTISFTNLSTGESQQSSVPNNETRIYCLPPARYAVTADAPPPWGDLNFELDVKLGEGIDVPLIPQ